MDRLILFVLYVSAIVLVACDRPVADDCEVYDYSNCDTYEYEEADFIVKFTVLEDSSLTPITIFKGYYEDKDTIFSGNLTDELLRISLPLNQYYSAVAEYDLIDKKILAVDGCYHELKAFNVCDSICYVIKEGKVDLRLEK